MTVNYYHVYAVNDWPRIVDEYFTELETSGLAAELDQVRVGIVGKPAERALVREFLTQQMLGGLSAPIRIVAEADEGWEQVTQFPMCKAAQSGESGMVLYSHTKGVATRTPENERWRAAMLRHLVTCWRDATSMLEVADVVGSHRLDDVWPYEAPCWLGSAGGQRRVFYQLWTESGGEFAFDPDDPQWYTDPPPTSTTVFAGNWWWTTMEWLAQMPLPGMKSRYDAEHWVASTPGHRPRVVAVQPGWPRMLGAIEATVKDG